MGVSGTLEYISELMSNGHKHKKKKKQFQTVNLKVRMDCDGCELKVKNALSSLTGVKTVEINRKQQKVTVTGFVEQSKVLKKAKSTGKKAEIWPYVPYNLVAQPYAPQSYDKKAPPGFVRKSDNYYSSQTTNNYNSYTTSSSSSSSSSSLVSTKFNEDPSYTAMFSDDNPNACSIM